MFDLEMLKDIKEIRTFEGKKAKKGLPNSIWETYSSFCNTIGGTIVLGIEELSDGHFKVCGVDNSDAMIKDFWNTINNKQKVSMNLLVEQNVYLEKIEDNEIIVIEIPRANREYRPVYINNNLFGGTYRRNGDGDYHCSEIEIKNMLRDQPEKTVDFNVVERFDSSVLDKETITAYRRLFSLNKENHGWNDLSNDEFLYRISAIEKVEDTYKPTIAGLLVFGHDYDIEREFPNYFLDYQEHMDDSMRWTNRLHTDQGDWTGNLYEFFFKVYQKLSVSANRPFILENSLFRKDNTKEHIAIREALMNCISNANFYDTRGILIKKYANTLIFENPGCMRVSLERAIIGGISDARNKAIMKIFSLLGLGEKAGSGLPDIFHTWNELGYPTPELYEEFEPERTFLKLQFNSTKLLTIEDSDKKGSIYDNQEMQIIEYLKMHEECSSKDVEKMLHIKSTRARTILKNMVEKNFIIAIGANRNRTYKLHK